MELYMFACLGLSQGLRTCNRDLTRPRRSPSWLARLGRVGLGPFFNTDFFWVKKYGNLIFFLHNIPIQICNSKNENNGVSGKWKRLGLGIWEVKGLLNMELG